jgi:hypothetical protein
VKNKIILLFSFFVLLSCSKNKHSEDVLGEDEMVEVLIDIHMTEGLVSTFPIHYDSSRLLYPYFENEIFKKHGITDSVFKKSLEYYLRDVSVMDRIYARTIDSLHVKEKSRIE